MKNIQCSAKLKSLLYTTINITITDSHKAIVVHHCCHL